MVTLQPIPVLTGSIDREGLLLLVDGRLAAVLVRLEDPEHGEMVGKWFLEAGFGHLAAAEELFDTPDAAATWISARL